MKTLLANNRPFDLSQNTAYYAYHNFLVVKYSVPHLHESVLSLFSIGEVDQGLPLDSVDDPVGHLSVTTKLTTQKVLLDGLINIVQPDTVCGHAFSESQLSK